MTNERRAVLATLLIPSALVLSTEAAIAQPVTGVDRANNLSVMITSTFSGHPFQQGGGVIVGGARNQDGDIDTIYVATAAHVVRFIPQSQDTDTKDTLRADQIVLTFQFLPGSFVGTVIGIHQSVDVALIKVSGVSEKFPVATGYDFTSAPQFIMGNPLAEAEHDQLGYFSRRTGRLQPITSGVRFNSLTPQMIDFDFDQVRSGMSGSGLFDDAWRVIGLIIDARQSGGKAINGDLLAIALNELYAGIVLRRDRTSVVPLRASQISAGANHTCAVHSNRSYLVCWGGGAARLSRDVALDTSTTLMYDTLVIDRVDAGSYSSCIHTANYDVVCLADTRRPHTAAVGSGSIPGQYQQVSVGDTHACAIRGKTVRCWGKNSEGQLGSPSAMDSVYTFSLPRNLRSITVGGHHACALTNAVDRGVAYCWGDNSYGQLGRTGPLTGPDTVTGRYQLINAGRYHTCGIVGAPGLREDGRVVCWGRNNKGQLGAIDTASHSAPYSVATELRFVDVTAGGEFTCGVTTENDAYCWGDNQFGQLGNSRARSVEHVPVRVQVPPNVKFRILSAGHAHVCGLTTNKAIWCWGRNTSGELGVPPSPVRSSPVQVMSF